MKIQRQLYKISIKETCLYFLIMFGLINGSFFIYTLVQGNPRFLLSEASWIPQLMFPIFLAVSQNAINRNGVLRFTGFGNVEELKNKLDPIIQNRRLTKAEESPTLARYTKKTKLGQFLNFFLREDIRVKYSREKVLIYGKKHVLDQIESDI